MATSFPRLFLIRHGNTEWAESHRFTGRTDLPLNARGEEKARGLQLRLRDIRFSRVFTSPLQRARKTCELAGFGNGAEVDADLLEWNYGEIEGRFSAEVYTERPGWELFRDGAPGGETAAEVAARADRFIARVRGIAGDVAAFTSGHIGRMIGARWVRLPTEGAGKLLCETGSVGILSYEHGLEHPAMGLWNDSGVIAPTAI